MSSIDIFPKAVGRDMSCRSREEMAGVSPRVPWGRPRKGYCFMESWATGRFMKTVSPPLKTVPCDTPVV